MRNVVQRLKHILIQEPLSQGRGGDQEPKVQGSREVQTPFPSTLSLPNKQII